MSRSASPARARQLAQPLRFRLPGGGKVMKRVAVVPEMATKELESVLVAAFGAHHAISAVHAVHYLTEEDSCAADVLWPLAAIAEAPHLFAAGDLLMVVHPPTKTVASGLSVRLLGPRVAAALESTPYLWAALIYVGVAYLVLQGHLLARAWHVALNLFEGRLRELYRHGPMISLGVADFGFWEGADLTDICARATSHDASFWQKHPDECERLYAKKEASFLLLTEYVGLAVLMLKAPLWSLGWATLRLAINPFGWLLQMLR